MSSAYFNRAEVDTFNLIETVAKVDDLSKRGELDNYKYNDKTGKIEPKETTDEDLAPQSKEQLVKHAVENYVQKLSSIPKNELANLISLSGVMSIQSSASKAGTLLKAENVVLGVLNQTKNVDARVLGTAKELIVQESALLKIQNELHNDFNAFKEEYFKGLPLPSLLNNIPAFLTGIAKNKQALANLNPAEKRVLANLVAAERELIALEKRAENISRKTILPEIQHLRLAIDHLAHSKELQKELEFDKGFGELQSELNAGGETVQSIDKMLTELQHFLLRPVSERGAEAVLRPNKDLSVNFKKANTFVPLLRSLTQLMKDNQVLSPEITQSAMQKMATAAEQIVGYQSLVEGLSKQGSSLAKLCQAMPALNAALDGVPPLKTLRSLSPGNLKELQLLQAFGPNIQRQFELMDKDMQAANKGTLGGLYMLLDKIQTVSNKQADTANVLLLTDKLAPKTAALDKKEIALMLDTAEDLSGLSTILSNPSLVTASQLLYHKTATEFLRGNQIKDGMDVLSRAATQARFAPTHPLANVEGQLASSEVHKAALGVYVSGQDTGGIKERAIHVSLKKFAEGDSLCFDFKLNHHARETFHQWSDQIMKNEAVWKSTLPKDVKVTVTQKTSREGFIYPERESNGKFSPKGAQLPNTPSVTIAFTGLGEVTICPQKDKRSLNDWINVKMPAGLPKGEEVRRLNLMLTLIGCPPSVVQSREIDQKRNEIMNLYRLWFPAEAFKLEKTPGCFDLTIQGVQAEILKRTPAMAGHLKLMDAQGSTLKEGFPGKMTPSSGITKQMKEAGAFGLMIGMNQVELERIVQILQGGFLSCQQRYGAGVIATGASNYKDHELGGAESVFTRLITSRLANRIDANEMPFGARLQILVDLETADAGSTYCYSEDAYGTRTEDIYTKRQNLLDLTKDLEKIHTMPNGEVDGGQVEDTNYGKGNEIMIRDHIPPKMIRGILVQTKEHKDALIAELKKQGLTEPRSDGLYVLGKPIDQFIQLGNKFKKEMWDA